MKIGFCGSSVTYGESVDKDKRYTSIIDNALDVEVVNIGVRGAGNRDIFIQALTLLQQDCDIIFVQWAAPGRQEFLPQWNRRCTLNSESNPLPYIKNRDYAKFVDIFKLLDNSYNQYKDLYIHSKILNNFKTPVHYINANMHIDPVFLSSNFDINFNELDAYTKDLIDFDNLPDDDIMLTIEEIRSFFLPSLGNWVNTDQLLKIDRGYDGIHPGPDSHKLYANEIMEFIRKNYF